MGFLNVHFHCKLCKCLPHNVTSDLPVYMQCFTSVYTETSDKAHGWGALPVVLGFEGQDTVGLLAPP